MRPLSIRHRLWLVSTENENPRLIGPEIIFELFPTKALILYFVCPSDL